jgi:hypothetical protein
MTKLLGLIITIIATIAWTGFFFYVLRFSYIAMKSTKDFALEEFNEWKAIRLNRHNNPIQIEGRY